MSVRIHSNWTTHHKSSIYHAWFHLLPWIVTPDRRNCHTPLHILHRQVRPEMYLLEMSQDEVPHRSQVVRDNAVQSQARGKVWCRWRPRIAARNVLPQRRNIGSHYRHLAGGQNIPISCSLSRTAAISSSNSFGAMYPQLLKQRSPFAVPTFGV
jgi:hypothetical protein